MSYRRHAWFEVPFPGLGWVTCDPTPIGPAGAEGLLTTSAGARSWWSGGLELLRSFLDGQEIPFARLRGLVARILGERRVHHALAALVLLGLLFALRRRARPPTHAPGGSSTSSSAADPALARLLEALARAGLPRAPESTLREHARALVTRAPALVGLEPLVERLYCVRFGGDLWSGADEHGLTRALEALAQLRRPAQARVEPETKPS